MSSSLQCLTRVDHPVLCTIHNRSTSFPTRLTVRNMLIVHILPRKYQVAALAMKSLTQVDSDDVTVDRVFDHRFTRIATFPQALDPAVHVPRYVPFTDASTNTRSGANDPHPAGVARFGPVIFVDAGHTTALTGAGVEIFFVDPQPFHVGGTSTLATWTTRVFLLWSPIIHDGSMSFIIHEVCNVMGRTRGRRWYDVQVACSECGAVGLVQEDVDIQDSGDK